MVLNFLKPIFFFENAIYDYVSLSPPTYDFISETVTPGN